MLSLMVMAVLSIASLWPAALLPHDPLEVRLRDRFVPVLGRSASGELHLLGTDSLGRDTLSRLMYSGRYTLLVSIGGAALTAVAAVGVGTLAGYLGGAFEAGVLRLVDALLAVPVILLAVALAAILGRSLGTLIVILSLTGWADFTRVVRADTLTIRSRPYVESARALGSPLHRVITRTVIPNLMSSVIVMGTYTVARFILLESSISFLGLGVTPPASSWGAMIGEARQYVLQAPSASIVPGIVITICILATYSAGDALRDRLDPNLRSRRT